MVEEDKHLDITHILQGIGVAGALGFLACYLRRWPCHRCRRPSWGQYWSSTLVEQKKSLGISFLASFGWGALKHEDPTEIGVSSDD